MQSSLDPGAAAPILSLLNWFLAWLQLAYPRALPIQVAAALKRIISELPIMPRINPSTTTQLNMPQQQQNQPYYQQQQQQQWEFQEAQESESDVQRFAAANAQLEPPVYYSTEAALCLKAIYIDALATLTPSQAPGAERPSRNGKAE